MIAILLESAVRSLVLAGVVWAGLRAFGVRNVVAQKAAWGMVLTAALTMPLLASLAARWPLIGVVLPVHPMTLLEELQARIAAKSAEKPTVQAPTLAGPVSVETAPKTAAEPKATRKPAAKKTETRLLAASAVDMPLGSEAREVKPIVVEMPHAIPAAMTPAADTPAFHMPSPAMLAWLLYAGVAAILLGRLAFGLGVALRLSRAATPVTIPEMPEAAGLDLRMSAQVASPVTIGSAIVLPMDFAAWEPAKLRVVLAHERSHLRQGDFYLQLMAGFYAALVWFSPLGWWMQRKLSDLAEAISDRAALAEAASRATYAQLLLEFAASPRPTPIGVAMARSASLSRRIERLLNPSAFQQAFAGGRRALVALLLVPVALVASTALVRVQAASQEPAPPPAAAPAPQAAPLPASPAGSAAEPGAVPAPADDMTAPAPPDAMPAPAPTPEAAPAPAAPPKPLIVITPRISVPAMTVRVPEVHVAPRIVTVPEVHVPAMTVTVPAVNVPPMTVRVTVPPVPPTAAMVALNAMPHGPYAVMVGKNGKAIVLAPRAVVQGDGYGYHIDSNGDSYVLVTGDKRMAMNFSGELHTDLIDKARAQAHGNFLWFSHGGKAYYIDDPATIARIQALYAPMEALGKQQEELGRQQEALGKQQEELGERQEKVEVEMPDLTKEMAEVRESMAKLQADMGKKLNEEQLSGLQERLGELQGRLGELQAKFGERRGELGEQMGALGEKMGALGERMGKLGEEQGRIGEQADRTVRSIIDQSLKNGTAKPVQ